MRTGAAALLALLLVLPAGAKNTSRPKIKAKPAKPHSPQISQAEIYINAGLRQIDRGRYALAIGDFTRAIRHNGGSKAYYLLGYSHYQRGFIGKVPENADKGEALEALKAFSVVLALDPALKTVSEPHRIYQRIAFCYEALGSNDKALEAYSRAFHSAPKNPMIPIFAARLRFKMGNAQKSASNLSAAFKAAKNPMARKALAKIVMTTPFAAMMGDPATLAILRRYEPPSAAAGPTLVADASAAADTSSVAMRDAVRDGGASGQRRKAMSENDKAVMSRLAIANDELRSRNFRQALASFAEVMMLNQNSGFLSPDQIAFIHGQMGTAYNGLGQADDAITFLRLAVRDMPFNAAAHYQLALAYSVVGRLDKSLAALKEALRTSPSLAQRRRYKLLAKTDVELAPVRDRPGFKKTLAEYQ